MKTLLRAACVACMFLLLPSCQATPAEGAPTNATCPFNPEEAVDASSPSVDYEGKKIAFCCKRCAKKFSGMSADDQQAAVAQSLGK